jgi:hypothetical protein
MQIFPSNTAAALVEKVNQFEPEHNDLGEVRAETLGFSCLKGNENE